MATTIPIIVVPANDATYLDLRAEGVAIAAAAFHLNNPTGRVVLMALLDPVSAAKGTLALPTQPTAGDTMTIGTGAGSKVYTFRATADYDINTEIEIIASGVTATRASIVAAINGTDAHNTAHTQVTAALGAGNTIIITAIGGGYIGNIIITTETFTAVGNVFDAAVLGTTQAGGTPTAVTITVAAVDDAYGRGGGGAADVVFTLSNLTDSIQAICLNRYSPNLFNQSGVDVRQVLVTPSALTGTGRLVGLST